MSFSILIQSLINELSHSLSINFPLSNDIFILFGNFSLSFNISSFKYIFSNSLSTSNNNSSSLLLIPFLIFVNTFCISNFISSLFFLIFSIIIFNSSIENIFAKSSNYFIFFFKFCFLSPIISS